jgi:pimeloyl-ACP methyl ester carboxylesterase
MRTCVYDRARIGFSDPAPRPNTSSNAVQDLYKALAAAGIKPHYLMVGNLLGGGNAQAYAYCYPRRSTARSSSSRRQKTKLRA